MASLLLVLWGILVAVLPARLPLSSPSPSPADSFVDAQRARSLQGILDNIGPDGALSQGAAAGLVVASPSTVNPDYLYTWTRDSALTLKTIIDEFINGNVGLQRHIQDYIAAQARLQTVSNPSGSLSTGAGLAEPKFLVDGTPFTGAWGRPQRDGPALRAIALMTYITWLLDHHDDKTAVDVVWPVVVNDLNYVGQYWNQTGFDLWEEVSGSSFFTVQNQHRALAQGSQVAQRLGRSCPSCDSQAPQVLCFLNAAFWNGQYLTPNINVNNGRSGKDVNVILGSIAVFDIDAECDNPTFQPCHSKSLANFKVVVDSFRPIYGVNAGIGAGQAVAIGRYPEDTYYNGNPWYLATLACAEFLYDAVAQWRARGHLRVDDIALAFFRELYPAVSVRDYRLEDGHDALPFEQILQAVTGYADGFVDVFHRYLPPDGRIAEQFDRGTGGPVGARDLTWSYAAFVTMARRRRGGFPASWNSRAVAPAPASCGASSAAGVYAPATAAGAPALDGGGNGTACRVTVVFRVNATTYFGESVFVVGNRTELGGWDVRKARALGALGYSAERPLWEGAVEVAVDGEGGVGVGISYGYVRKEADGSFLYEVGNRTVGVDGCGMGEGRTGKGVTVEDSWRGPVGVGP